MVELAVGHRFRRQLGGLAGFVGGEVAGVRAQQAAIELDDAGGHAIEEGPVVGDHDRRRLLRDQLLDQRDAVEVEVIGRFVEEQEVRREGQRQGQRRALLLATGRRLRRGCLVETEAMQEFDQPRFRSPALALVGDAVEPAPDGQALAQRGGARQLRLLLDQHDGKPVAPLDLPVVERRLTGDDLEQRRLAGAVAADEADALAVGDDEAGAVEERMKAEGELGVLQGQERHGRRINEREGAASAVAFPA